LQLGPTKIPMNKPIQNLGLNLFIQALKRTWVTHTRMLNLVLILCIAMPAHSVHAHPLIPMAGSDYTEYQVKAAFLPQFTKFVTWPSKMFDSSKSPIVIGILGKDHFGDYIDQLLKKGLIQNRKLEVKRFKTLKDLKPTHLLFISSSEKKNYKKIFAQIKGCNVLTVGDTDNFIDEGGMICFVNMDKKVRFKINIDAYKKAGLKISSNLLRLAVVEDD